MKKVILLLCLCANLGYVFAQENDESGKIIELLKEGKKIEYCPDNAIFERAQTPVMYKGKELRKSIEFADYIKTNLDDSIVNGNENFVVVVYADVDCNGVIGNYKIGKNFPTLKDVIFCKSLISVLNNAPVLTAATQRDKPVTSKVQFKITVGNGIVKLL